MIRTHHLLVLLLPLALLLVGCGGGSGFKTTGEASWYGPGFEGRPTASGERFDPSDFTAAHASLTFGTRVRVTNTENNRTVIVRINDRFPGIKGRIIDLSRESFSRLAPLERGVIPVRLEVVE